MFGDRHAEECDTETGRKTRVESIRNTEALTMRYETGVEGLQGINYTKRRTEIE